MVLGAACIYPITPGLLAPMLPTAFPAVSAYSVYSHLRRGFSPKSTRTSVSRVLEGGRPALVCAHVSCFANLIRLCIHVLRCRRLFSYNMSIKPSHAAM